MTRLILMTLAMLFTCGLAHAHDLWIGSRHVTNHAGEWCCGVGDCGVVLDPQNSVDETASGYHVHGLVHLYDIVTPDFSIDQTIPFKEALPSADKDFWYCRRADNSRRCFFAPPGGV